MTTNAMQAMLDFLLRLEQAKIFYRLGKVRAEALMVEVAIPGERWEVEFFADGQVEAERFVCEGEVRSDAAALELILARGSDDGQRTDVNG